MIPGEARLYVVGTLWQLCADPPLSHHSPQDNRNTPPTKLAAGRASCCCWTKSDESRNNNLSARASLLLVRISVSSFKINFFTTGFRSKHIYLLSGSPMITEHFLILKKIELNFNFRHSLRKSNNYIAVSGPGRMRDNSFELVALVVAGWARQQPVCRDGRTDGQTDRLATGCATGAATSDRGTDTVCQSQSRRGLSQPAPASHPAAGPSSACSVQ